jgi:hypothetical protein
VSDVIFRRLMREHFHHPHHYDQPDHQEDHMTALSNLISAIERDAQAAGHTVDGALHTVLQHHLSAASVLQHAADEAAALEGSPFVALAEEFAGLPPGLTATVAKYARELATDLGAITGAAAAQPAPEAVPAEVPA